MRKSPKHTYINICIFPCITIHDRKDNINNIYTISILVQGMNIHWSGRGHNSSLTNFLASHHIISHVTSILSISWETYRWFTTVRGSLTEDPPLTGFVVTHPLLLTPWEWFTRVPFSRGCYLHTGDTSPSSRPPNTLFLSYFNHYNEIHACIYITFYTIQHKIIHKLT